MSMITQDKLATMLFTLEWDHDGIHHSARYYADRVNFWRDLFPKEMSRALPGKMAGDDITIELPADYPLFQPCSGKIVALSRDCFQPPDPGVELHYGRFYPQGLLRGVCGVYPGNVAPFRCTSLDERCLAADLNHPLAGRRITFTASVLDVRPKFDERGGTVYDWLELAAEGPGIQCRANGRPTAFFTPTALSRADETADVGFYQNPRMVQHLDDDAIQVITDLYGRLLPPGGRVLDLMSSWTSHLPHDLALDQVLGLGMNAEELAANPRLTGWQVHDLNQTPRLPYADGDFDAVICTASVEYLIHPDAVFREVARVLKPGGVFAVAFSNRWFPPKAIRVWSELHEFERLGMVLEYFLQDGNFTDLHTLTDRGRPRPAHDRYADTQRNADPVFAAWGRTLTR